MSHVNETQIGKNSTEHEPESEFIHLNQAGIKIEFNAFVSLYSKKTLELPQFPVDVLPEIIDEYVKAVAESLQVSTDMVAVSMLSVIALCVQGKFEISPKSDHIEPLNLYIAIIARPSERKSPVLREIMDPVYTYVKEENEKKQDDIDEYQLEKKILSGQLKTIEESLCKDKGDHTINEAKKLKKDLRELEKDAVQPIKLVADDVTPEALAKTMSENGERMGIFSAEGGLFGMLAGRYNDNCNLDLFLKSYSGEPYSSIRITRQGEELSHPLLTILLLVQPKVIMDVMENEEFRGRGLLARFLYSIPKTQVGIRKYRTNPIAPHIREKYKDLIFRLLGIPVMFTRSISLSEDAFIAAESFFNWIECRLTGEFEEIEDWAGKIHGTTMRIAGILHVVKYGLDAQNKALEIDTMGAAIAIGKYFIDHSSAAFDIMGLTEQKEIKNAKYIIQRLLPNDLNDLNDLNDFIIPKKDALRLCQKLTAEEMEPSLQVLVDHGYVSIVKGNTGKRGRPSEKIYINPEYIRQKASGNEN